MVTEQFGYIYNQSEQLMARTEPLTYMGKKLEFFVPTLSNSIAISETDETLADFAVTFFQGSDFAQTLGFKTVTSAQTATPQDCGEMYRQLSERLNDQLLARIAFIYQPNIAAIEENALLKSSLFMRGSKSLLQETLAPMSGKDNWHMDGRGAIFVSPYEAMPQPRRVMLLIMLALAYQLALNQISEKLAEIVQLPESADNIRRLDELYLKAAKFNAQFYFSAPVQVNRYATYQAWETIGQVYQLEREYQETNTQLEQVHRILNYHHQKMEQQLLAKRNRIIKWFGAILTLASLFEPIDIFVKWLTKGIGQ